MPYRIDLNGQPAGAFEALVEIGALDVEAAGPDLVAILPDEVSTAQVAEVLGPARFTVGLARGRDDGSVWVVRPLAIRVGPVQIVPADWPDRSDVLRMQDGPAFGTGLHPTTALCLEALEIEVRTSRPDRILDVGTGSGILALTALRLGVAEAVAIDTDPTALAVTAANARMNELAPRLHLARGGPEALSGAWPIVCANILTAPLVEMAPTLARLVGRGGRLLLSGIRSSLASEVSRAYRHVGMRPCDDRARDGWTALGFQASW